MPSLKNWIQAFRLRTLPLALSGIGMGSFLAAYYNSFRIEVFILSLLTTIFLQVLSNLANDYGDSQNGADSSDREGPSRAVQAGLISPKAMKRAVCICAILSFVSGVALLFVSVKISITFLLFVLLGLGAIAAAIKYTMGKNPYGYSGFGDLFVFIFFGLASVLGTYFLHTNEWNSLLIAPAISCGLFAVGVLNVNNIRDISSDTKAGKRSIPVMIGEKKAKIYHGLLFLVGFVSVIYFVLLTDYKLTSFLFLLITPGFIKHFISVYKGKTVQDLDPLLKQLALLTLVFVLLFGIGINL